MYNYVQLVAGVDIYWCVGKKRERREGCERISNNDFSLEIGNSGTLKQEQWVKQSFFKNT